MKTPGHNPNKDPFWADVEPTVEGYGNAINYLLSQRNDLMSACERMIVGITKEDTDNCEWYEGIEHDAAAEAQEVMDKIQKQGEPSCEPD